MASDLHNPIRKFGEHDDVSKCAQTIEDNLVIQAAIVVGLIALVAAQWR